MAKDKKSFLLYTDLIHTFEHLTDEQKGKVFYWVLQYVNDLEPMPLDGLLQAVVEPIKRQLKRDLKAYENKTQKRSEAGKKGAQARWQKITNDSKRIKPMAKMADNDNDTVNDNVNDIDYKELLSFINKTLGRSFRIIPDSTKNKYKARLKEGFTKSDIQKAILNASKDSYHIDTNYKYLTPEFFSRADKLNKFCNFVEKPKVKSKNDNSYLITGKNGRHNVI